VNMLVVGASHRTAGVDLLERLAVGADDAPSVVATLLGQEYVGEALVLSTCNRVEVYTAVSAFHGGLADVGGVLAERSGLPVADLAPYLYVWYAADAVRHAFRVAAGLDSMVVGEAQILGQLREAYGLAVELGATGRLLHELMQQALRVGKRAHAETGIDRAGQSIVTAALELGLRMFREDNDRAAPGDRVAGAAPADAAGVRALVVGAGSMGALALATLRRAGAERLYVCNRSPQRAQRLADAYDAVAISLAEIPAALGALDVVVCATASPRPVLTAETAAAAGGRPLLVLDLAVPRDVAPGVAEVPGITLVDLDRLGLAADGPRVDPTRAGDPDAGAAASLARPAEADVLAAEQIVAAEVEAFLLWLRGADVAPTVAALRARADEVVAAELRRLQQRRPDLTDGQRAEVAHAVHRVVQRLLHQPTVRVRQLASEPGGEAYAAALRELFDLEVPEHIDPVVVGGVTPE
jgi:glutamyl-tRNA reductase